MQTTFELKTTTNPPHPAIAAAARATARKSASGWKPQPCGLSREQLRDAVAEILG